MKPNLIFRALLGIISLAFSMTCLAGTSNPILDTTTSLLQNDPIQWGRISRNGEPQDWIGSEPFGGIVNPDWQFHYHTYTIPAATLSHGRYVQINFDDLGLQQGNIFVSAYANSYDPTSLSTNWLGDAGTSGNLLGTNPVFFQVLAPPAADLVIVVWNTDPIGGLGVGERFRLLAEQFTDVTYTEPVFTTINLHATESDARPVKTFTLTFTASPAPTSTTTVDYATSGTAVAGTDYSLSGGTDQVTFSPGQTSATVTFTATNHGKPNGFPSKKHPAVSATIAIEDGTGYSIGPSNSVSIIVPGQKKRSVASGDL